MLSAATAIDDNPELALLQAKDPSLFRQLERMQRWKGRELRTQGERAAKEFGAPKLPKAEALRQLMMEKDVFLSAEVQEALGTDNNVNTKIVHARTRDALGRLLGHPPSRLEWQTLRAQRYHYAGDPDAAACSLQVQNDFMRQGSLEQGVSHAPDAPLFALSVAGDGTVTSTATSLLQYTRSSERPLVVVAGSIT